MLHDEAKTNRSTPRARDLGETHRRLVVDRERESRIEVPDRVVRERREVHDGDDAVEMPRLDVADVRAHVDRGWRDAEIAAVVEHRVGPMTSYPSSSSTALATAPT